MNVSKLMQETVTVTPAYRNYNGGYFKTLISPEQSGGVLAILDMVLPKGAEPPLHVHEKEDETFYLLEGAVQFVIDGTPHMLEAGSALFAPLGIPHYFEILTDTVRILTVLTPGDFWNYFMEFSEPCHEAPRVTAPAPPTPGQIRHMAERLSDRYHLGLII